MDKIISLIEQLIIGGMSLFIIILVVVFLEGKINKKG